jgi:hypothetical protein
MITAHWGKEFQLRRFEAAVSSMMPAACHVRYFSHAALW